MGDARASTAQHVPPPYSWNASTPPRAPTRAGEPETPAEHAAAALKALARAGVPHTDPRCQALMRIAASAPPPLLPSQTPNTGTAKIPDVVEPGMSVERNPVDAYAQTSQPVNTHPTHRALPFQRMQAELRERAILDMQRQRVVDHNIERAPPACTPGPLQQVAPHTDISGAAIGHQAAEPMLAKQGATMSRSTYPGDGVNAPIMTTPRPPPSVFAAAARVSEPYAFGDGPTANVAPASNHCATAELPPDALFQVKAQVSALRVLSRGGDPAPELLVASAGRRRPRSGPTIPPTHLRPEDPRPESATWPGNAQHPNTAYAAYADPAASDAALMAIAQTRHQRMASNHPVYQPGYQISSMDVHHPPEQLPDAALRQRVRRAQAQQARLERNLYSPELGIPDQNEQRNYFPVRDAARFSSTYGQSPPQRDRVLLHKDPLEVQNQPAQPRITPQPATISEAHAHGQPHAVPKPEHFVSSETAFTAKSPIQGTPALAHGQTKMDVGPPSIVPASPSHDQPWQPAPISKGTMCAAALPRPMPIQRLPRKTIEELMAERERRVKRRIESRVAELVDLPLDLPANVRRRSVIEAKSLSLVGLQRAVRGAVTGVMHSVLVNDPPCGFGSDAATTFKRPAVQFWVSTSGHTPPAGVPLGVPLAKQTLEHVRQLNQAHYDRARRAKKERDSSFGAAFLAHASAVRSSFHSRGQTRKKLMKDVDRYHRDRAREEDRKRRKEQQDRLRALRNNDEEQYLALLQNTKNTRLLQLIKQTDEYLSQLGAKVEQQKVAARAEDDDTDNSRAQNGTAAEMDADSVPDSNEADGSETKDSIQAMRARRNHYYTISHSIKEKVRQPSTLVGGTLKAYQLDGLEWMVSLYNNGLNGILADEMGLGKTIQTISLLTYLVEIKGNPGPFLIINPLSTMSNWVRELERWAPSLRTVVYRGNPETRRALQQNEVVDGAFNVLLTTYEFVVKDKNFLGKVKWKYIIIDEGHRMKNADCKLALTLGAKYKSRNRILLTGTPLQNNLTELWALLNFLLPSIFSSADTFETWFNAPFQASSLGGSSELNEEEQLLVISRLHQVLRPFMLRRLKTDVETQLPDKVENVMRCDMSIWQRVLYRQMRNKIGIASSGGVRTFNNIVMQLKKICNHPYLFYNDDELYSLPRDFLIRTSGKFVLLEHAFRKLRAAGHRVLMFSQMTAALDYLEYFLAEMGLKYMRLDGTTKADDRQRMLEEFNRADSEYFCFILSTRAGGLGLNLQTADTVFIFDSDWNPMMDLQAQDRAHRIGQKNEVRVFRLITAGSVEEKILERANQKLQMDAQVIQAGQFNNKSSENDRTQMLKEILQSQTKDDGELEKVPSFEEMNRMLARTDEEFGMFQEIDAKRLEQETAEGRTRLMVDEKELPSWVMEPENTAQETNDPAAELELHGRGRRKRSQVLYDDGLTEKEWTAIVDDNGDVAAASRRKRRRKADTEREGKTDDAPVTENGATSKVNTEGSD